MRSSAVIFAFVSILFLLLGLSPASARLLDLAVYRFDTTVGEPDIPADLAIPSGERATGGYYLVQSDGPVTEEWKAALESAGAVLYGHVREFAFLAGMDASALARVQALPGTSWVGPFHPAYKLAPEIGAHVWRTPERIEESELLLVVRVFENLDAVSAQISALGGVVSNATDDGFSRRLRVRLPEDRLADVARIPDVWWIEEQPEYFVTNNMTRWVVQSNVSGSFPLWDHGINGTGQIATIMDTGVDYNSCWFREVGNLAPGPSHRKVINYAVQGGGAAYDGCDTGHGSHVAGTMLGDQSYITGSYDYNGMAYKAKLTVQDVGADDWSSCNLGSISPPASLTASFNASYTLGARVHTNSWGSTDNAYDSYSVDVDNAMWNHKDYMICFAAGNSGPNLNTVGSPGTAKNCITVGATMQAPSQETMASYSSRGPSSSTDARYKPTVTAPGGSESGYINSVDNDPGNPPSPTCSVVGNPFMGTSMATPCVSGMALNVRQYYTDGYYPQGVPGEDEPLIPSAALIKATLINSTDDMNTADIPNNNEGWGRLLVDRSLFFSGDTRELVAVDLTPGLSTGGVWNVDMKVDNSSEPLTVALVWTDYPGTAGTGVKLINDLDLTVTSPTGTQYKGNVFSAGFSTTGGSADRLNVEECVRLNSPAAGTWTFTVRGYNVPQGPQPFALVVNGAFQDWPPVPFSAAGEREGPALRASVSTRPNPAMGLAALEYAVPSGYSGPVTLDIVDATGRLVRRLVDKGQRAGMYTVTWDGRDELLQRVDSGVYFARLTAGQTVATGKVIYER
ncbi:MAG: S8 family serine peptidase [Candidatus Eisenbacteria bacterium]|nr:S8 family serine peptidase [Candidatus Eisenbacteria bacterium]